MLLVCNEKYEISVIAAVVDSENRVGEMFSNADVLMKAHPHAVYRSVVVVRDAGTGILPEKGGFDRYYDTVEEAVAACRIAEGIGFYEVVLHKGMSFCFLYEDEPTEEDIAKIVRDGGCDESDIWYSIDISREQAEERYEISIGSLNEFIFRRTA